MRIIHEIHIRQQSSFHIIDIVGKSFLWSMVRYMVSAINSAGKRKLTPEKIKEALAGGKIDIMPAAPAPLLLVNVNYKDIEFIKDEKAVMLAKEGISKKINDFAVSQSLHTAILNEL